MSTISPPPFKDTKAVYLEVDAIRSKWASMLRWCIDWRAHEYPLYALFSSIFSTLSDTTSAPDNDISPATNNGPLLFSYPQCRLVSKETDSDDPLLSVIPDFALMFSHISESSDRALVLLEDTRMLVEIKRLYDRGEDQWFWTDGAKASSALRGALKTSIRQLILQAYCAFNVFEKKNISIMFICGTFFSLFRLTRPENLPRLPEEFTEPGPSSKKRKLDDQSAEYRNVLARLSTAKGTSDSQLSNMIPMGYIEVVYHAVPVFVNLRARQVHLSDGFRQALHQCLDGIDLQPCSLFDLQTAQFSREDAGDEMDEATKLLAQWYKNATVSDSPQTPSRKSEKKSPYDETSPLYNPRTGKIIPEMDSSPGYKGRDVDVEPRTLIPRKGKQSFHPSKPSHDSGSNCNVAEEADRGRGKA